MGEMRAALIGCGLYGGLHADTIRNIEGIKFAAFCDVFEDKGKKYLNKYGGDYSTTDYLKVISDDSIDAVYICTQNDSHASLCIEAAKAGKYIMLEKPLAITEKDCYRIVETVERTRARMMMGFKMRFFDMVLKAKELIPNPVVITMQGMDNRWPEGHWGNDPVKGGGNIVSQGCHSTDILRFMAGADPIEVCGVGANYYQKSGVVDNLCAIFRFNNKVSSSWIQGDCNNPPYVNKFYMQVFAENKSITLSDRLCRLTYSEAGKEPEVFIGSEGGVEEENKVFLDCIINNKEFPVNHVDGYIASMMVIKAIESVKKCEPLRIMEKEH